MKKPQIFVASVGLTLLTVLFAVNSAEAVTCAKGVNRAGCVGPNGAVGAGPNGDAVAGKPATASCRIVNGVKVCK
jgi:hypothetical protein